MSFVAKIRSGDHAGDHVVEKTEFVHHDSTPHPFSLTVPNKGNVTLMVRQKKGDDKLIMDIEHGRHVHQNKDFIIQGKLDTNKNTHTYSGVIIRKGEILHPNDIAMNEAAQNMMTIIHSTDAKKEVDAINALKKFSGVGPDGFIRVSNSDMGENHYELCRQVKSSASDDVDNITTEWEKVMTISTTH